MAVAAPSAPCVAPPGCMNLQGPQTGANTMLLSVAMSRGFNDIESMNDNSSHRQVLSAFDEAIARART